MISCQIQKSKVFIDKPSLEREIHCTAHKLLYQQFQAKISNISTSKFRYDVIERFLTDYLNTKQELAEHRVTCYQDTTMSFAIILDVSFRYDEIGVYDWRTMRLTFDIETFTDCEPDGHSDRILFGCETYNG